LWPIVSFVTAAFAALAAFVASVTSAESARPHRLDLRGSKRPWFALVSPPGFLNAQASSE